MRIQHNIAAMNSYRNYGVNNGKLNKNLEKLSSGYKINRAGDDAAGLAVSEKMRAQITGLDAATKNAKDGIGLIQTAEGALTEVHDMLNRMYYLAEQAANGTYETADRENLDLEVKALNAEIDRIGKTANFNGKELFTTKGLLSDKMAFAIGDLGGPSPTSNVMKLTFSAVKLSGTKLTKLDSKSLKLDKIKLTSLTTADKSKAALTSIKKAINVVSQFRAQLGADQNRLEHTVNNLGVMRENIQDAESTLRDTDMAEEMMAYTKNNIMNQAAQAMLASANQQPQGVLQLLG
jgi:flagellin